MGLGCLRLGENEIDKEDQTKKVKLKILECTCRFLSS